jgi:hypothetical protein
MKTREALFILAATMTAVLVHAEKVPLSQAPARVQEAIRQRSGTHRVETIDRNLRNGQVTYEASWKDNGGAQQQLSVSEAGTILRDVVAPNAGLSQQNLTLANRVGIALPETPPAVQDAIHNRIVDAPVDGIQRGIWNGQNIFEITYHENGRLNTFQVTESGQPVVSEAPARTEGAETELAAAGSASPWQLKYSGLSTVNVPLSATAKIAFHSAPRPVQETVNNLARGARIEDFQRGTWNDHTVYQAVFQRNGQNVQLQVLDDGTLVSNSPFAADNLASPPLTASGAVSSVQNPATPPPPQPGLPNAQVGVPDTAAASTQPRYAGLADFNVQLEGTAPMAFAGAPSTVRRTVDQLANGARIEDFQRGNWNGQVVYEAAFRHNGQDIRLQVLDDGSVLTKSPGNVVGAPAAGTSGTATQP